MHAFGSRAAGHERSLMDFTGHDLTIDGYQGVHDMNARQYIPGLGIFGGVDPLASSFPSYTPYHYVHNNPINLIDPTGMSADSIKAPDSDQFAQIESYINSRAAGTFKFDITGNLEQVESGSPESGSTYYAERLVEAIEDPNTIEISISDSYSFGGKEKSVSSAGEGVTVGATGHDQSVTISGRNFKSLFDEKLNFISDTPADILAHELVGHAIPGTVGPGTGNAVTNENIVRKENGLPLRRAEPHHVERKK